MIMCFGFLSFSFCFKRDENDNLRDKHPASTRLKQIISEDCRACKGLIIAIV